MKCAFCPAERENIYICPRCNAVYCGLTCYKSKDHVGCTESFSRDWVTQTLASEEKQGSIKPNPIIEALQSQLRDGDDFESSDGEEDNSTFDFNEFLQENLETDQNPGLPPKNPRSSPENEGFPTHPAGFLQQNPQEVNSSFLDSLNEVELNEQLRALGIDPDDDSALLDALDEREKEEFTKMIANLGPENVQRNPEPEVEHEMERVGEKLRELKEPSQGKNEKEINNIESRRDLENVSGLSNDRRVRKTKRTKLRPDTEPRPRKDDRVWYEKLSGVRFADDIIDFLPDIQVFQNSPSLPPSFTVNESVLPNLINILSTYCIAKRMGVENVAEFMIDRSKSLYCHQEYESPAWAAMEPIFRMDMDKTRILPDVNLLITRKESGSPLWIFALADLKTGFLTRKKWTKFAKRLDFFVLANNSLPFLFDPVVRELYVEGKLSCI